MRFQIHVEGVMGHEEWEAVDYFIRLEKHWSLIEVESRPLLDCFYVSLVWYDEETADLKRILESFDPEPSPRWTITDLHAQYLAEQAPCYF